MTLAFVFPGQGSQSIGMLAALGAEQPLVRSTFDEASTVLGYDLWDVVQNGPAERLNSTECTQPAMLAASYAVYRVWLEKGGRRPDVVSGHSLGEFTALVAAGAIQFPAAIGLVQFRGRAMQDAVPLGTGAMAAVLGLDDAEVEAACAEAAQGSVVEAVNYNSPGQIVIAGETAAVNRAIDAAKARGAKRAVLLPVSVPSHSSLMLAAAAKLGPELERIDVREPLIPYVSAVDALPHTVPSDLRAVLVKQLASPVRWSDTVRALVAAGPTTLAEVGPGKVLTSLNKRIEKRADLQCVAIDDVASIESALAIVNGASHV